MEFDLVMQSILEHVFTSRLAFFRTTSGLVYIFEYCEIIGILTVITECWKLPHGGNFRHLNVFLFFSILVKRRPEIMFNDVLNIKEASLELKGVNR